MHYIIFFIIINIILSQVKAAPKEFSDQEWKDFKDKFGKKNYDAGENAKNKKIWSARKLLILEHNARADQGLETYSLDENSLMDFVCSIPLVLTITIFSNHFRTWIL
jgi:hypothetical protein